MVKVIMGLNGAGKTKSIIDLVTKAANDESGSVVCIEKNAELMFDVPHSIRLIKTSDYEFSGGYGFLQGFISGLHAGNYDISHIFIDSLMKIAGDPSDSKLETFLDWCEKFSNVEGVKFTISVNSSAELASPGIRKYL